MKQINKSVAANGQEPIPAKGKFIWLKSATGPVLVETDKGESAFMSAGDFVRTDKEFTEIYISDLSGATNNISVVTAATGDAGKFGNVAITSSRTVTTGITALPTGAWTLILPANSDRAYAEFQADGAVVNGVRIGENFCTGPDIWSPTIRRLETSAALYGYQADGVARNVHWAEFTY